MYIYCVCVWLCVFASPSWCRRYLSRFICCCGFLERSLFFAVFHLSTDVKESFFPGLSEDILFCCCCCCCCVMCKSVLHVNYIGGILFFCIFVCGVFLASVSVFAAFLGELFELSLILLFLALFYNGQNVYGQCLEIF